METLLKVGTLYPEMAAQEKGVDFYIELLRQDQVTAQAPAQTLRLGDTVTQFGAQLF